MQIPDGRFPVFKTLKKLYRLPDLFQRDLIYISDVSVHHQLMGNRGDDKNIVEARTVPIRKDDRRNIWREIR